MTRNKKDIPLSILEALEILVKENNTKIKVVDPKKSLIKIEDYDPESNFYFEVTNFKTNSESISLQLDFRPKSKNDTGGHAISIALNNLPAYFKSWCDIVKDYDKIESIYNDTILKANEEYFYHKFEIIDEDAQLSSFNLDQQIYLDDYLDNVAGKLTRLKEGKSEEDAQEIDDLVSIALSIRRALTKETKRQIINRLAKFWGKAQKMGLEIIKEIFVEVSAEIAKKLLLGP